jgi:hypothetical protein
MILLEQADMGQIRLMLMQPRDGSIGGTIIHHHHLVALHQGRVKGLVL